MDVFNTRQLRQLTQTQNGLCVTIFMPTHIGGSHSEQDSLRLKNLLQQAEKELISQGMRGASARLILAPARNLLSDSLFWKDRSQGLAMFISTEFFRRYRLPLELEESMSVNQRFHVKPILPMLARPRFYLLTLSQNRAHLYEGSSRSLEEIEVPQMPESMKEALNYDQAERGSQTHSAMQGARGKQAAVFHGHGGQPEATKGDLASYFRAIDAALHDHLREENVPLLLGGVEYLLPIYRQVASYRYIAEDGVVGNCDYLTPHQLHEKAWPLIEPALQKTQNEAAKKYLHLSDTEKTASAVEQVVPAAFSGRVETLFVDRRARQWGVFDPETNTVQTHADAQPGDDDLLDLAAVQTLLHRGSVYTIEGKQTTLEAPLAALLRY